MKEPPRTTSVRLNLAPMVDVTMCLLIFFMVTTKMVERENSAIDLPVARSAKNAEKQELGKRFVVNIRDADPVHNTGAAYVVQEKPLPLSEVFARLKAARRLDVDLNCVIRAQKNLPYKYVQAVMVACARADVRKVTFSAVQREGSGG
ncbi:MAG: ExbD/TolR family protein [Phycisphaerae bacterium]